jgi:HlyD family secretion protein
MIPGTSAMDKPVERPKGLTPRIVAWGAAGAVLLIGLAVAFPTVRRWARADRAVEGSRIRVGEVVRGDLERDISAQGRIVAALHPTLYSPAQGIVALQVKAGTEVKKGRLLARIDSPELTSRLQQERSTLLSLRSDFGRAQIAARQAEARNKQAIDVFTVRLAAARRALERAQALFDQGLLNRTDFERAQDDVQVAGLELKNGESTQQLERETLEFEVKNRTLLVERQESILGETQRKADELTMVAPFDGVVATIPVQDREAVAPNQAVMTVVNLDAFEVEFDIPENYAADVAHDTRAEVLYEGKTYPGRVTAISPEIKDSQVKGTVVFAGEPPPGLRQSQRVSTRLILEKKSGVLKLPRGPFLESGGGRHAYVVEGGMAVKREIVVGAVSVGEVEVVKGLTAGDKVVLSDTSVFEGAGTVLIRN